MAAVATIQQELQNLQLSSKRHNNELSQSSKASLSILEAASQSYPNDQLAIHSLRNYEGFVTPFILACSEASAKSCASALQCIQTLAMFQGIAPSRLHELIHALKEATQLGLGIQLKILQVLPVLLFEFSADLSGDLVVDLLQVCAELLGGTKVAMVHNAAYATLQQLLTGVFDRTDRVTNGSSSDLVEVVVDDQVQFQVSPPLHDSIMVLLDLCDIAEKTAPRFLKIEGLSLTFTLELLELTLSNQAQLIHRHKELASVLRLRVTTLLLRLFSEAAEFPVILRVVRIFYLLLRQHLSILTTESEVILSTLCQGAVHSSSWKRLLCLEVLQGVTMEVELLSQIYSKFDAEKGRTKIIENIASQFASILSNTHELMLASEMTKQKFESLLEKQQNGSTNDSSSVHAQANQANTASTSSSEYTSNNTVIITKSEINTGPMIEMLDRVEPPRVKLALYYYLIIKCVGFISDDVHKLVSMEKENASAIISSLSTPLLKCNAACLSIAMDVDIFRQVVRAVQRLAHGAGIIGKKDIRDEFIQLLVQHCYLPDDIANNWVLGRCSLTVRALFNLGYALGNQLGPSWSMITSVIYRMSSQLAGNINDAEIESARFFDVNDSDFRNINLALKKLLDSTTHLNDEALINFMIALDSSDQPCKFNLLKYIVVKNVLRFGNAGSKCWPSFSEILLKGVMNPQLSINSSNVLNDTSLIVLESCTSHYEDEQNIDKLLGMVILSICAEIDSQDNSIKISAYQNLNMLLEKFGAKMSGGWDNVFGFISTVPTSHDLDIMRCAFKTLELVCSDFLEHLPYPCVFKLTLCLDDFARQTVDLNTSFTATSLFWTVCDHLMAGNSVGDDLDPSAVETETDLIVIAQDYESSSKRFALWLFAVIKLASISGCVGQQQVRTSAIQILLRLFDTHGSLLPIGVWDLAYSLVFPELLKSHQSRVSDSIGEIEESRILIIDGITKVQTLFFNKIDDIKSFQKFWLLWTEFLKESAKISPKISNSVYRNLRICFEADDERRILPRDSLSEFLIEQNLRPEFSTSNAKLTADSLIEFVSLYKYVKEELDVLISLKILTDCIMFPYYTSPLGGANGPQFSGLQAKAIDLFDTIDILTDPHIQSESMLLLNRMALSPFADENKKEKANFTAVSTWAQKKLLQMIDNFSTPLNNEIESKISVVLVGMNEIVFSGGKRSYAIKIILRILEVSTTLTQFAPKNVVDSFKLILAECDLDRSRLTGSDITETTNSIEKFVEVIRNKKLSDDCWSEILKALLHYSVLYARGVHNEKYYDQQLFDWEPVLQYGTVETVVPVHISEFAFFCLETLQKLSHEKSDFSALAKTYFTARIRAVLNQYIGDCKILGQEPLQHLISEELIFSLKQLRICQNQGKSSLIDPKIRQLVLTSLSRAHKNILPLLQEILIDEN